MKEKQAKLWVVATPIGNIEDLSPRARHILESVDYILAEDTRNTIKLFKLCNIKGKKFISFHDHNETLRLTKILDLLRDGSEIALVSDAGTPVLSDPGFRLIQICHKEKIPVSPVPGPSAPICALSACGIAPLPHTFLGFLPRSIGDKEKLFKTFANINTTLIFFERKDRLKESLNIAYKELKSRDIAICRELTKKHEQFIISKLEDFESISDSILGEITVVIGPAINKTKTTKKEIESLILDKLKLNMKSHELADIIYNQAEGWTNKEIYNLIINLK